MDAASTRPPAIPQDQRTERLLGALASTVLVLILGMVVFVFSKAWPSFAHNGLRWFGNGPVDEQLLKIFNSPANPDHYVYEIGAWSLLYATALITFAAVVCGTGFARLSAV